jgi:pheromone shutdown-related protein TraB
MSELAEYLPSVKETLIDERDRYLAARIWSGSARRQVAVVGAGHLLGIRARLERIAAGEDGIDVTELDRIPPASILSKAAGWIFPLAIVGIIVLGFFFAGAKLSLSMLLRWLLWNGSLAALGSLIALAHPLAILVSFVGAPIATLNPFIGVGLFSGVAEATLRKPRVSDAQNISDDVSSLKGIYRNRITRALLVFLLSSLGGMAGNFIAIPSLISRLFGR